MESKTQREEQAKNEQQEKYKNHLLALKEIMRDKILNYLTDFSPKEASCGEDLITVECTIRGKKIVFTPKPPNPSDHSLVSTISISVNGANIQDKHFRYEDNVLLDPDYGGKLSEDTLKEVLNILTDRPNP